ncbi:hypothetical protein DIPPA_06860 [Diplonema papillatum]|nr:hypothetical protein DIPPA_06860 [Diplonema papillatum]
MRAARRASAGTVSGRVCQSLRRASHGGKNANLPLGWQPYVEVIDEIIGRKLIERSTTTREFVQLTKSLGYETTTELVKRAGTKRFVIAVTWIIEKLEQDDGPLDTCTFTDLEAILATFHRLIHILDEVSAARALSAINKRITPQNVAQMSPVGLSHLLGLQREFVDPRIAGLAYRRVCQDPLGTLKGFTKETVEIYRTLFNNQTQVDGSSMDFGAKLGADLKLVLLEKLKNNMNSLDYVTTASLCSLLRISGDTSHDFLKHLDAVLSKLSCRLQLVNAESTARVVEIFRYVASRRARLPNVELAVRQVSVAAFNGKPAQGNLLDRGWPMYRLSHLLQVLDQLELLQDPLLNEKIKLTIVARTQSFSVTDAYNMKLVFLTRICEVLSRLRVDVPSIVQPFHDAFFAHCDAPKHMDSLARYVHTMQCCGIEPDESTTRAFLDTLRSPAAFVGLRMKGTVARCVEIVLQRHKAGRHADVTYAVLDRAVKRDFAADLPQAVLRRIVRRLPNLQTDANEATAQFVVYLRNCGAMRSSQTHRGDVLGQRGPISRQRSAQHDESKRPGTDEVVKSSQPSPEVSLA